MIIQKEITLPEFERGFHLITSMIINELHDLPEKGLLNVFIKHTSAGLTINENADYTVRVDFQSFFNTMVSEKENYVHNSEGRDDMPAHLKSSIVGQSINIPITDHQLNLGIWQGIYLCEFRNRGGRRRVVLTVFS
ncbi:MAG: secondary thiamine-phosphate synthase enzyme YjbQ [Bacteroidota bacterium]